MYDKSFVRRIAQLRFENGVSARDMSLSIGKSERYINKIENSKAFPSMEMFFIFVSILKYLQEIFLIMEMKILF